MDRLIRTKQNLIRRKSRIRSVITGTSERPRLCVNISNQHVSAQIINDETQSTIASITTVGKKQANQNMTQKAEMVGVEIAKLAKTKKIKKVVFDRNGKLYHGRIKALADKAREGGLEF